MKSIQTLMIVSVLALMGCDQTVNTISRAQPEGKPKVVSDKRIITDESLNAYVQPLDVSESVVSGDLTKIQVTVYNSQSHAQTFYYKFEWYDDQEMYVDTPMSIWTDRTIQGGEEISLVGVGPNPRCKDFKLKLELSPN